MSHQDTSTHHHHHFMPTAATSTTAAPASIDSFSQLPFIRTASSRDNPPNYNTPSTTGASLRLFGFDFPRESSINPTGPAHQEEHKDNSLLNVIDTKSENNASVSSASTETGANRKFECHYCCRNFPTSQALGGHQNAHKRERQQARRAQFQTSMTTDIGPMYSPFSYYRLGSIPSVGRFESTEVPPHYPSWVHGTSNLSTPSSPRFYGGLGSVSEPINGNTVSGSWRLPVQGVFGGFSSVHHDCPMPLPLLAETNRKSAVVGSSFFPMAAAAAAASNNLVVQDHERGVKDGVSLDLHL